MAPSRSTIAARFAASAPTYDRASSFHGILAQSLADELRVHGPFKKVLEIGAHTGVQTERIQPLLQDSPTYVALDLQCAGLKKLHSVCEVRPHLLQADAHHLPLRNGQWDLILSCSTLQWLKSPYQILQQWLKNLKPGGILAFSTFLEPSLDPLKSCFQALGQADRFQPLPSQEDFLAWCASLGAISSEIYEKTMYFPSWSQIHQHLKYLGIGASKQQNQRMSSRNLQHMQNQMETLRSEKGLPLRFIGGTCLCMKKNTDD